MAVSSLWTQLPVSSLENPQTSRPGQQTRSCLGAKPAPAAPERRLVRKVRMSKLFFINIPYNCSDRELQEWVESRGIETLSIRIVRDLVSGVSPAFGYVELKDPTIIQEAVVTLNGKKMRNQTIFVKEAQSMSAAYGERRTA